MGKARFSMSILAELNTAIAHFKEDLPALLLYSNKTPPEIKEWIDKYKINLHQVEFREHWDDFDIHCFQQTWASTAKGWGGIGGAAMTTDYTVAIYNSWYKIIAVYWDGILAYCIEADEIAIKAFKEGNLPGNSLGALKALYRK